MSALVATQAHSFVLDDEKLKLIKNTIAKDATNDELDLFLYHVKKTGLDPMAKQIYFQKRFNKRRGKADMTIITGIDGYRLIADRTGDYAGNDDPVFDNEENPAKATVTVYKIVKGIRCPFTASARWEQYYPGDEQGFMWRKMPHLMLGKCAEALALRKAFPAELSGVYVKEEMDQAGEPDAVDVPSEDIPFEGPPAKIEAAPKPISIDGLYSDHHKSLLHSFCKIEGLKGADYFRLHDHLLEKKAKVSDLAAEVKKYKATLK